MFKVCSKGYRRDFPGGTVDKNLLANTGKTGSIPTCHGARQEDPTCHGATKPVYHNYWSLHALELALHNKRNHRNEKPEHRNEK